MFLLIHRVLMQGYRRRSAIRNASLGEPKPLLGICNLIQLLVFATISPLVCTELVSNEVSLTDSRGAAWRMKRTVPRSKCSASNRTITDLFVFDRRLVGGGMIGIPKSAATRNRHWRAT